MAQALKSAALTRAGFEYQDLIGIEMLISFYRNPSQYRWMQLESEDTTFGYLDDVVVARADNTYDLIQVKFTGDADKYFLDWAWLLEKKPRGTSLLTKWATSLARFKGEQVSRACLRTNRRPDKAFLATLKKSGFVDFDALPQARKQELAIELGSTYVARSFFKRFRFDHSQPMLSELESELRDSLIPSDCDMSGWLQLAAQAKRWSMHRNQPEPDGRIMHAHLTQIITKKAPRPMQQSFAIPDGYAVPSQFFHDEFKGRAKGAAHSINILWGTPGRGKSTYLSFLTHQLRSEGVPVIRHHYFLSLDDTTSDRFSYPDIATSLMDQMGAFYADAVKGLGNNDSELRTWLEACGQHFAAQGSPFLVIVDGLDHVYRERQTLVQLDHLFDVLLPCPPNVILIVGTQRVPDDQLPSKLIKRAKKKDWLEIPAMDQYSVQNWVAQQYKAKRLRLQKGRRFDDKIAERLGKIGIAFYEISGGHPLHLIYSFEYLVRKGGYIDADGVRLLPPCPEGDIDQYYATLWRKLSQGAREIIHLIAGCDFRWPFGALVRRFGQIDEIDFLLEHRRTGLVPFHGSILAFVRAKDEHKPVFASLLPRVVNWLRRDAGPYHKWGWLWLMEAHGGNYGPLLHGVSRDWVMSSMAAGWPLEQIVNILKVAERKTFDDGNYAETIRYRSLKHRVLNCEEMQGQEFARLLECALTNAGNDEALAVLADGIGSLSENRIAVLARVAADRDAKVAAECAKELAYRVNLWLSLRHRPPDEFMALSRHFVEVAGQAPPADVTRIVRFIAGFRDDGTGLYEGLIASLVRGRRATEIAAIIEYLKVPKYGIWRRLALDALMEVCTSGRIDIRPLLGKQTHRQVSGFAAAWAYYHKVPMGGTVIAPTRPSAPRRSAMEHRPLAETYLYDIFFHALASELRRKKADAPKKIMLAMSTEYLDRAAALLVNLARNVASGAFQLTFSTPYFAAAELEAVLDRNIDSPEFHQYWGFKTALRKIAIGLHLLKQPMGVFRPVSTDELVTARASLHWVEELFVDEQLNRALPLLSTNDAAAAMAQEETYLSRNVTVFNERADKWVELARIGVLYGLPKTVDWIRRAANCFIGYGWRKDLWLDEVLECVREVHEYGAANGLPMLRRLAPIVEKITDFTDGDETDGIRSALIEVTARVSPSHLPDFYAHHIDQDEFRYAEVALSEHFKITDIEQPATSALAHTFTEYGDISMLREVASKSDAAQRLLDDQLTFLGGTPPRPRDDFSSSPDYARTGVPPDVKKIPPDQFRRLLKVLSNPRLGYEYQQQGLRDWLLYWESQGKARDALRCFSAYLDEEENVYQAESLLDEAFQVSLRTEGEKAAYPWLVLAHIHRRGWSRYFTSTREVMARLDTAAKYYKDDWQKFIHDTAEPALYWKRRDYDFSIGSWFLVHFLLLVGQKQVALEFTRAAIRVVEDEVSDQPLGPCAWLH